MKTIILCLLLIITMNSKAQTDPAYPAVPPVAANITQAEYFIDTDPGFGNGTSITISHSGIDLAGVMASINTSGLLAGAHRLYIRSANADGKWSITNVKQFVVDFDPAYPTAATATHITQAEYFIDADPGFGNGTAITISPTGVDLAGVMASINTSSLLAGAHKLYIRTADTNGKWGITNVKQFVVDFDPAYPTEATATHITQAEYFIDTDPGFGNGTAITISSTGVDLTGVMESINTGSLLAGAHKLYIRTADANGIWSVTNVKQFTVDNDPVYPTAAVTTNITKAEYFIDTDPGFGNGIAIVPLTPNTDINNLTAGVNTNLLLPGAHKLYIRTANADGMWSVINEKQFVVDEDPAYPPAPTPIGNITTAEFFIDNDPGFGNGTPIAFTPATNLSDLVFAVPTAALTDGTHNLYVRSKNNWGITAVKSFVIDNTLPLDFISFTAYAENEKVKLQWITENEVDVDKFEIQHSMNGLIFTTIGTKQAFNLSMRNTYSTVHDAPQKGINYYRIKQIDRTGAFTYSQIVKVIFGVKFKQTIVAPNPVQSVLQIIEPSPVFVQNISLLDVNGNIVLQKTINKLTQLYRADVQNIAAGAYILKIQYKNSIAHIPVLKQ